MKKKFAIVASIVGFMLLQGCASIHVASKEEDSAAKSFNITPEKSTIYLFRDEMMGAAVSMDVYLDGKFQGYTGAQSYFMWVVDPGSHEIKSEAENDEILKLETEANKIYYIWQEVKMGFMSARNKLQVVSEERGKKGVSESKLIDVNAASKILESRKKSEQQ